MKATLISYNAKDLSKTESSKLSKKLMGYKDSSNKGKYSYKREGKIRSLNGIIISKSTFIIPKTETKKILSIIKQKNIQVTTWNIEISENYFKVLKNP